MAEPEHLCMNCQHYGGINRETRKIAKEGDCHNMISGRMRTTAKDGCEVGFYPCVIRWPLRPGPGGVR